MTNLDSILKSRGIALSTKVHLVKAMVLHTGRMGMCILFLAALLVLAKDWKRMSVNRGLVSLHNHEILCSQEQSKLYTWSCSNLQDS